MNLKAIYVFAFLLLFYYYSNSQSIYPKNYFASPLPVPLKLAGNFGEIRNNHFHSGLDLKTNGNEGMIVMAAASGYVSRIKVSNSGFGRAIYITHPNGFVTVYGHLYCFATKLDSLVKIEQRKINSYETEFFLPHDSVPVDSGEVIGLSGNSGSSEGPHLHFEIREEKTEQPCNPLLFGIQVTDTLAPIIKKIVLYSFSFYDSSAIISKEKFNVIKTDSFYTISRTINAGGLIAFGFEADDQAVNDSSLLGIYASHLIINNEEIYSYRFNKFHFNETKYVNAHIDYSEKTDSLKIVERSFLLPGNLFSCYSNVMNHGKIKAIAGKKYNIKLILEDYAGNKSVLIYTVSGKAFKKPSLPEHANRNRFYWKTANHFEGTNYTIDFPPFSFYNDFFFTASQDSLNEKKFYVGNEHIPIHTSGNLKITLNASDSMAPLYGIALIRKSDTLYIGGAYSEATHSITSRITRFGCYILVVDTLAPSVINSELLTDSICNCHKIITKVNDNLSGISYYQTFLNDNTIYSEFDLKKSSIITFIPKNIFQNIYFSIVLSDRKGNNAVYKKEFILPDN